MCARRRGCITPSPSIAITASLFTTSPTDLSPTGIPQSDSPSIVLNRPLLYCQCVGREYWVVESGKDRTRAARSARMKALRVCSRQPRSENCRSPHFSEQGRSLAVREREREKHGSWNCRWSGYRCGRCGGAPSHQFRRSLHRVERNCTARTGPEAIAEAGAASFAILGNHPCALRRQCRETATPRVSSQGAPGCIALSFR